MVNENRLPSPIPASGAQVVQVVDAQQRVIGGSVTADRLTPLLRPNELATALGGEAVVLDGVRVGSVRAAAGSSDPCGTGRQRRSASSSACRSAMCSPRVRRSGTPCSSRFRCCSGRWPSIAWRVIGWTLRPVEQLRAGAEQISRTGRIRGSAGGRTTPGTGRGRRDPRSRCHPQRDARSAGRRPGTAALVRRGRGS